MTITPSSTANGVLSDPNAATDECSVSNGVMSLSGTAAQVTADLDALVFTPTAHQVAPGGTVTTGFTIAVTDTAGQSASNAATTVVATAAEDAPVIGGLTTTPVTVNSGQTVAPFPAATITDPDFGASETTTITLTANGTATDANGTLTGATKTGTGTYVISAASPAAEQALLQAVIFTPTANTGTAPVNTGLTVQVSDGIAAAVTNANTVVATQPTYVYPVPGDPNHFTSTSTTSTTTYDTTPVAQTSNASSTTITAVLNGTQTVFSQTFALPYSDPAVQAAVAQADAILTQDTASPGAPVLASSATTNQGSQTNTVQTGQQTSAPTVTVTTNYGPGTIMVGPSGSVPYTLLAGQVDQNTNTGTVTTIDQTTTTTTTLLTSQNYTISGTASVITPPSPPAAPVLTTSGQVTNTPTPALSGTAAPGATVTLLSNGIAAGSAVANAAGSFTVTASILAAGLDSLSAIASVAGSSSAASSAISVFELPAPRQRRQHGGFQLRQHRRRAGQRRQAGLHQRHGGRDADGRHAQHRPRHQRGNHPAAL